MISPSALKKGDTLAIISTARKISKEELAPSIKAFENWGLHVVFGSNLFKEQYQFAGNEAQRLSDLQWAIDNPEINAIMCARGGYGTTRFVDQVNLDALTKNPKWICGFSDVTALIGCINRSGVEALHSTMPIFFSGKTSKKSIESLRKVLFGEKITYTSEAHSFNIPGTSEGEVVGGNLSILNNCIGTLSDVDWDGKILFMEDLDEYIYHIDRMMVHLDRCGKLKNLAGLIVGSMSSMHDNNIPFGKTAEEIILEHCSKYDYPICFGFPVGHEMENYAMICGRNAHLEISDSFTTLAFDE